MGDKEDGVQPPIDAALTVELAATAQRVLHEAESLLSTLKSDLDQVKSSLVSVAEAAQTKVLEANTAAHLSLPC